MDFVLFLSLFHSYFFLSLKMTVWCNCLCGHQRRGGILKEELHGNVGLCRGVCSLSATPFAFLDNLEPVPWDTKTSFLKHVIPRQMKREKLQETSIIGRGRFNCIWLSAFTVTIPTRLQKYEYRMPVKSYLTHKSFVYKLNSWQGTIQACTVFSLNFMNFVTGNC